MATPKTDECEHACNRMPIVMAFLKMRDHAKDLEHQLQHINGARNEDSILKITVLAAKEWSEIDRGESPATIGDLCRAACMEIDRLKLALHSAHKDRLSDAAERRTGQNAKVLPPAAIERKLS